jgi:hypothetical protein
VTVVQIGTSPDTFATKIGTWPGGFLPRPVTPYLPDFWGYLVVPTGADPTLYPANVDVVSGWTRQVAFGDNTDHVSPQEPLAGDLYLISSLEDTAQFPDPPTGFIATDTQSGLFAFAVVPSLRFMSRQVHKTVARYVEEKLTELGWVNDPVNFGTVPLTFQEAIPEDNGKSVETNTVSITIGDVSEDIARELGGGYYEVIMPIFVDVYGQTASTSQSIADDVKEQMTRGVIIPVYDWTASTPVVTSTTIEFENVLGPERPQASQALSDFRKYWRVVKVEAHVFYEPAIG